MNFEKTRILSSDVMKLLKQVFSEQKISALEKDLLKEKLRAMYEALDEDATELEQDVPLSALMEEPTVPEMKVEEAPVELPELKQTFPAVEPIVESFMFEQEEETEAPSFTEPALQETESSPEEPDFPEEIAADLDPGSSSEQHEDEDGHAYESGEVSTIETTVGFGVQHSGEEDDESVEELFYFQEAKELSDRLSLSPISDLTKALGINDRLLTVNELFGGDFAFFDESFRKLNSMNSFEEAKTYLKEYIVIEKGWIQPEKKDRAKRFIKFVKRRYLNT